MVKYYGKYGDEGYTDQVHTRYRHDAVYAHLNIYKCSSLLPPSLPPYVNLMYYCLHTHTDSFPCLLSNFHTIACKPSHPPAHSPFTPAHLFSPHPTLPHPTPPHPFLAVLRAGLDPVQHPPHGPDELLLRRPLHTAEQPILQVP